MESVDLDDSAMADTTMHDAALLDPMEDLFGDVSDGLGVGVDVPLPTALPPPPALVRRLAEMQASGCSTKLSWSNTGSVAHISPDGRKVAFRIYRRQPDATHWSLSEENSHPLYAPEGLRWVHLQFSYVGQDLAAVDDLGHVHLYYMNGSNGKMHPTPTDPGVDDVMRRSDLDGVIGLYWLPIYPLDCRAVYISPATRGPNGWSSQSRQREPNAVKVHHPADNGRALLSLSRSGKLTLQYQMDGWRTLSEDLGVFATSDDILSHADFCEHNGNVLLVTYDWATRLRLFSISLVWNATYATGPNNTQHVKAVAPAMQVMHLAMLSGPAPQHAFQAKLCQLRLLPAVAEVVDQNSLMSTIVLATFNQAALPLDSTHQLRDSSTIFARWQVEAETPALHDAFRKLKPKSVTNNIAEAKTILRRQSDTITSKTILSIHPQFFNTIIACVASDGTIEFRDRNSFTILEPFMDPDHVYSLPQTGFEYLLGDHNVHTAISGDGTAMAVVRSDGVVEARSMSFRYGWPGPDVGNNEPTSLAEAGIVCLARQIMFLSCSNVLPDEILSLLPSHLSPDMRHLLCKEVFRQARYGPDVSGLDEKTRQSVVLREPLLPRGYSVQLYLSTKPDGTSRTLSGQLAWATLNLRHVGACFLMSANRLDPNHHLASEWVHSLRGQCKWGVDLITYVLNALLSVKTAFIRDPSEASRQAVQRYMHKGNNPAILLLLCTVSRSLLRALVTYLPRLIKLSQVCIARARSVVERQQLAEIGMLEKGVPFSMEAFKVLLDQVETSVQSARAQLPAFEKGSGKSPDEIMTITGEIPEALDAPLKSLITSFIPTMLESTDPARLHFAETSWLGLNGSKSIEFAKQFDVLKKIPLTKGVACRECRRCGSRMEELDLDRMREMAPWLATAHRQCVCTCNWFIP